VIMAILILGVILLTPGWYDIAHRPERMKVHIENIEGGYVILIKYVGDFKHDATYGNPNLTLNITIPLKWQILDLEKENIIASGNILDTSNIVKYNDSNMNKLIDVNDTIQISNPDHTFEGYYFKLLDEDKRLSVIHIQFPD
ncbi:MAG: hypothetical protein QGH39_08665, partial [Candidatus Thermoplasmatota archaeon]|nr:hypothetical protein [Candidatus Thermoplasmatota archaeon]